MDTFFFESYKYYVQSDGLHISFCFRVGDHEFQPDAIITSRPFLHPEKVDKRLLDSLVFNIGMIELVSYWKAFCPKNVVIKCGTLSEEQIAFWKHLYYNGLGEFFYKNNIDADPDNFIIINGRLGRCFNDLSDTSSRSDQQGNIETIIPIGGGKDSVVSLELLKKDCKQRPIPLIMNPRGATIQCVQRAGYSMEDVIVIKRTIDPHLLDVNSKGALNGHTPFSAMLAFYTVLASTLTCKECRIALSNESSANESTVPGTMVNHQYSKSLEFENNFRSYIKKWLEPQFKVAGIPMPDYFSFLRPLSELQIAMLFSRYPQYFDVFKSCNVGSKQDVWCGHCAKCLFAYIILSPFIEPDRLNEIFGKNMLDDILLQKEFDELTGQADVKPFECVGTVSEVNSALSMCIRKWYVEKRPALLLNYHESKPLTPLDNLYNEHNLPADCLSVIYQSLLTGHRLYER